MLLTDSYITSIREKGEESLATQVYNEFLKDLYAIMYDNREKSIRLSLLLYALDSWNNEAGAANHFNQSQLQTILDQISKFRPS